MLKEYKDKKQKLLNAYKKLSNNEKIYCEGIDESVLMDRANKLENEEFVLAIAGQMKAGKSTLLNALLFEGKEILPSDDTPMTAKITEIRYANTLSLKATFYSQKEWDELQSLKDSSGRSYFQSDIKPLIKDISIEKWLGKEKDDEVNNLSEYVGKGGVYTPFVKSVAIYYPSEMLKNLIIVDTPGTNDSNKFRSQVTLDWIARCDVAIYSTYTGRLLDENDYQFITNYLLHLNPEKRIVAVNKIDTANTLDDVKRDLNRVKNDDKFSKTIFNDKSEFVFTAALSEIIKHKEQSGRIDEDDKFYKNKLIKFGAYENSGIDELRSIVEKKLVQNKGEELINTHTNFIKSIFQKKNLHLNNTLTSLQNELEKGRLTESEIAQEIEKLREVEKFLHNETDRIRENFDENTLKSQDEIKDEIVDVFCHVEKSIQDKIDTYQHIDDLKNSIAWDIQNAFDSAMFRTLVKKATDISISNIQATRDEVIVKFANFSGFNQSLIDTRVRYSTFSDIRRLEEEIRDSLLDSFYIDKICSKSTYFW